MSKLLSLQTVALELGVKYTDVYRMVNEDKIHAVRVGAKWKVSQEELDRVVRDGVLKKDLT